MKPSRYAIRSHEALTRSLFKLGYFPEALQAADRALELGSESHSVRLRRAWIFARLGLAREALDECDKSLPREPAFPRPADEHARALCVLGRFDEALDTLDRIVGEDPASPFARCCRALVSQALGRVEDARADLEAVLGAAEDPLEAGRPARDEPLGAFARLGLEALVPRATAPIPSNRKPAGYRAAAASSS